MGESVPLNWPFATIDLEASSLEDDSYPIEVGIALWRTPDAPIVAWSTLIRPSEEWFRHGHWSRKSAKVHGIRGDELHALGKSPIDVAAFLNEMLGQCFVLCDGGPYDLYWSQKLFVAAQVKPLFTFADWHRFILNLGKAARERALSCIENGPSYHRAREDACQLLAAIAHALEIDVDAVQDLVDASDIAYSDKRVR